MAAHHVRHSLVGVLALALSTIACSDTGEDPATEGEGASSGAACPPNSTLTYDNFGRAFMETYCTRCHSSALSGSQRQGAPSDHDFDELGEIRAQADHIDEQAAAGPSSVNESMPRSGVMPTEQERMDLGEWLACGSPP